MARSRKPRSPETTSSGEEATDAPKTGTDTGIPEATPEEIETAAAGELPEDSEADKSPVLIEETVEVDRAVEPEVVDDLSPRSDTPERTEDVVAERAEELTEGELAPKPATESEPSAARPSPPPPPVRSGPGFLPLFLGGVAAAALGFVLARYAVPEGWPNANVAPAEDVSAAVLRLLRTENG